MFFYALLFISSVSGPDDRQAAFCNRLTNRFDSNEKSMAILWKFNTNIYKIKQEYADKVQTLEARRDALEHEAKIFDEELAGKKKADEIISLMVQADCPLPDHDATHLTFENEGTVVE